MEKRKIVKHSKYKNTGLLFELLVRQTTADIMSNKNNDIAIKIIEKYFKPKNSMLKKELRLYKLMLDSRYSSMDKSKDLITEILNDRMKLNNVTLKKEKYDLVKEIKDNYDLDSFFSSKIPTYKVLASIYMLFESLSDNVELSPDKKVDCKHSILEHMNGNKASLNKKEVVDDYLEEYMKVNDDLKKLSYKIMLEKFNDKYKVLNDHQKNLLREYIFNVSDVSVFRNFVDSEVDYVKENLEKMSPKIEDKTTRIKVEGIVDYIDNLKKGKVVKDEQLVSLMTYYELMKEVKKVIKCPKQEKVNG